MPHGGKALDQIGEALRRVGIAVPQRRLGGKLQILLLIAKPRQECSKFLRLELALPAQPATARRAETLRIAKLIIVDRMRQRHHYRRPADHPQFRNGRGPRAAQNQMCSCNSLRHVIEKGL